MIGMLVVKGTAGVLRCTKCHYMNKLEIFLFNHEEFGQVCRCPKCNHTTYVCWGDVSTYVSAKGYDMMIV